MTDQYAVMGNPIAHSKSPAIHTAFAAQTEQDMTYSAILVPLDGFAQAVAEFRGSGGKGLNVTVPFKGDAWQLADDCSARAVLAQAVNTLSFQDDGTVYGDNTDGVGLVRDLTANLNTTIAGCRVLLLGAGGAVQGVLGPLLSQGPERLTIANRTAAKAVDLAQRFHAYGAVTGGGFDALQGQQYDLVINGTAASLHDEVPPLPDTLLDADAVCYDMMYAAHATAFVRWGQAHGAARAVDGLGMLVEQAAEAFFLWRGVRPDSAAVIAALREGSLD